MYKLKVTERFSAAHHLREYKGKCEKLHGHNWNVTACVGAGQPASDGMVMDFHDLRDALKTVLSEFDHSYLNEHQHFQKVNPTSENMAKYIFEALSTTLNTHHTDVTVLSISVEESPGCFAIYER